MLCFALSPLTQLLHARRHARPPLRRAHVRAAERLARHAVVRAAREPRPRRRARRRPWASRRRFTTACSYFNWCRSARCSCCGYAAARSRAPSLRASRSRCSSPRSSCCCRRSPIGRACSSSACCRGSTSTSRRARPRPSLFMALRPFSRANLACVRRAVRGTVGAARRASSWAAPDFSSGSFSILDQITEAQSPYTLFTETFGPTATASLLQLAACSRRPCCSPSSPIAYCARPARAPVLRRGRRVRPRCCCSVSSGLHYFGFFALVTGAAARSSTRCAARFRWHRG